MYILLALITTALAYFKNLQPLIEVGTLDCFSQIQSSNPNEFWLTLGSAKSDSNYQYATAFNNLTHSSYTIGSYQRYSILISVLNGNNTQTSMLIKIGTKTSVSSIQVITMRWVVIDSTISYFSVYHFTFTNSSGARIDNSTKVSSSPLLFNYVAGTYNSLYSYSGIDIQSLSNVRLQVFMSFQHSGPIAKITYNSYSTSGCYVYNMNTELIVLDKTMLNLTHPEYTFKQGYSLYYSLFCSYSTCSNYPYTSDTNSSGIFMGFYYIDILSPSPRPMNFGVDVDSTKIILYLIFPSNQYNGISWIDFIPMMNCTVDQKYVSSVHECQFCAKGEYLNISANTCENCTNMYENCIQCNTTMCSVCDTLYYLNTSNECQLNCSLIDFCQSNGCQLNSTNLTCTLCDTLYKPGTNNDCIVDCPQVVTNCSDCNISTCFDCELPYYLQTNNSCLFNCSSLTYCTACHVDDPNRIIRCDKCELGYQVFNVTNTCESVCGNGIVILSQEQCDDNNTENDDGCSSLCTVQPHFNCSNTTDNPSICTLESMEIKVICAVKNEDSNQFTLTLQLTPSRLRFYKQVDWFKAFDSQLIVSPQRLLQESEINPFQDQISRKGIKCQQNLHTVRAATYKISALQANYDFSSNRLRILYEYYDSLQSHNFALATMLAQAHPSLKYIIPFTVALPQETQNNLSLYAFSQTDYLIAKIVKYLSFVVAFLGILLYFFGYLGAKLTALECLATVQVSAILLLSLKEMSAAFGQLKYLYYALGVTPIFHQNYFFEYSTLPIQANNIFFNRNILTSINIFWAVVILPVLVAVIIKILAVTKYNQSKMIADAWRNALGTYTFYGIFFLAYGEFALLAVNVRFIELQIPSFMGFAVGISFFILMIVYVIMSHKHAKFFGSFKNKFYRFQISQYVYTFSALQRFITAFLVVCLGPKFITAAIPCAIFILEIIFLAVKKPYFQSGLRSALAKKIVSVLICMLFMVSNFLQGDSFIKNALPLIILLVLFVIVIFSWVIAVSEVKKNLKEWKEKLQQEPQRKYKDIQIQMPDKQKLVIDDFREKMQVKQEGELANQNQGRENAEEFKWKPVLHQKIEFDKFNWDNYDKLYSVKEITTMKNKIRKLHSRVILEQTSEIDSKTPEHIKLVQRLTKEARKKSQAEFIHI